MTVNMNPTPRVIIHGSQVLSVGQHLVTDIFIDGQYHEQGFIVLRIATEADYLTWVAESGYQDQYSPEEPSGPYFYEIATD